MLPRIAYQKIVSLASAFKAVAIIGPRQSGKTTLTKFVFPDKPYVSLENPESRSFALEDPRGFLGQFPDGAILDEIQRTPELLSWLQQRLDEDPRNGTFILTGSNNFLLIEKISQSLAGRVAYLDLLPFSQGELKNLTVDNLNHEMLYGGYPSIRAQGVPPEDWFPNYVRTYVERDVRQIKNLDNLLAFERLLSLCAARAGQLLNYSNLSVELGVDVKTVKSWIGILQASYLVYLLPPYFKNYSKRVVKTPKLYFLDTGLLCHLLRIESVDVLSNHPQRGEIFENYIITELLKNRFNQGKQPNLYFWRDRPGLEVDVLIDKGTSIHPIEIKSGQTITSSYFKNLRKWMDLSGETSGSVIYAGSQPQHRSDGISVDSWVNIDQY